MKVQEIATWLRGELVGDPSVEIRRLAEIESAEPGDLTFLSNPKYEPYLRSTRASAVLVQRAFDGHPDLNGRGTVLLRVEDPYAAFARVIARFYPEPSPFPAGIDPSATISPTAKLGRGVALGARAVIGDRVTLGDGTCVSHGSVIGHDTVLGEDCRVYPNVTIYHRVRIGNRVTIHAGTVIGSDGFGYYKDAHDNYQKIPQVGTVILEDDVEIGASCTIDRATIGETRIKRGAKLDNLIQVGHNSVIGESTVIAGQVGLAGSSIIGDHCKLAGQVGVAGHLSIAANTTVKAQACVTKTIARPGGVYIGFPAREQHEFARIEARTHQLPEIVRRLREVEKRLGVNAPDA